MARAAKTAKAPADHPAGDLIARVRAAFGRRAPGETRMFGGVGFMLDGHMAAAASKRGVLIRVGKDRYGWALSRPHARPMEMRGRPVEGYVRIDASALDDAALAQWIDEAAAFVATLPPKAKRGKA